MSQRTTVIPDFLPNGNLPNGIHEAPWHEVAQRFGTNQRRRILLAGMLRALRNLKQAGCSRAYLNGSFVTAKECPGDFDAAWETTGVKPELLHPVLLDFTDSRSAQKLVFGGELFPADYTADAHGRTFAEFFQTDREGRPKGIIAINLRTLP